MSHKILFIDDNADMTELGSRLLKSQGHEIQTAGSGQEVLDMVQDWKPDLFVVDLQMEGIGGLELIKRLREMPDFAETPILIVSGIGHGAIKAEGFRLGADAYLTKPYEASSLREKVREMLGE